MATNPQPELTELHYVRPRLYEKQRAFVDSPARYTIVEASTKTGKTVGCLVWLFEKAISGKRGQNFWWVAPIYQQAGIAFRRLKAQLRTGGITSDMWHANESDQSIEIAGRRIWFKGADKPDGLYGEDVYGAVFDEATRAKAEAWHAVRSTLTATQGPVKIIGNVRGRKNWAYNMARRAEAGAPDMAYFKLTAWDAVDGGVLKREEVEDAQRNLPEHVFRELYLAEPADDGGNPFGLDSIRACAEAHPVDPQGPIIAIGVDLAKSHDHSVACGLNEQGNVCRLERWQSDWGQTRRRVLDLIGNVPTLVDATGVGDPLVEDFYRAPGTRVEGFKFTAPSKQQLMEGLAAAIQRREITFPPGWLTNELEAFEYEYRPGGGVRYQAPEGLFDDGVCALALAVRKWSETRYRRVSYGESFVYVSG